MTDTQETLPQNWKDNLPEEVKNFFKAVHKLSFQNIGNLNSHMDCFSCLKEVMAWQIEEFADNGQTVKCPHCGIDSVFPLTIDNSEVKTALLEAMNAYYFDGR